MHGMWVQLSAEVKMDEEQLGEDAVSADRSTVRFERMSCIYWILLAVSTCATRANVAKDSDPIVNLQKLG